MNRQEQLEFCKRCLHQKMDLKQGLICSITGEKAEFDKECPDYEFDETIKVRAPDHKEGLQKEEIALRLPSEIFEELRLEQNLLLGVFSGLIIGAFGAIIWGLITVVTGFQIGFMALAIGAGVGLGVRKLGKGIDRIFGYWAAIIALISILLGNFLSIIGFVANYNEMGYIETLFLFDYSLLITIMAEAFSFIDLVFYAIALYTGYIFSFRKITEKDIEKIKGSVQ